MRTLQQLGDEAAARRRELLDQDRDPSKHEFPMTRAEIRALHMRPWKEPGADYGDRICGLKIKLVEG